jgi:hypothetical protein
VGSEGSRSTSGGSGRAAAPSPSNVPPNTALVDAILQKYHIARGGNPAEAADAAAAAIQRARKDAGKEWPSVLWGWYATEAGEDLSMWEQEVRRKQGGAEGKGRRAGRRRGGLLGACIGAPCTAAPPRQSPPTTAPSASKGKGARQGGSLYADTSDGDGSGSDSGSAAAAAAAAAAADDDDDDDDDDDEDGGPQEGLITHPHQQLTFSLDPVTAAPELADSPGAEQMATELAAGADTRTWWGCCCQGRRLQGSALSNLRVPVYDKLEAVAKPDVVAAEHHTRSPRGDGGVSVGAAAAAAAGGGAGWRVVAHQRALTQAGRLGTGTRPLIAAHCC